MPNQEPLISPRSPKSTKGFNRWLNRRIIAEQEQWALKQAFVRHQPKSFWLPSQPD